MHRAGGLWRRWAGGGGGCGGTRPVPAPPTGDEAAPGAALELGSEAEADPGLLRASSPGLKRRLRGLALVRGRFVSAAEAAELLRELEPVLGRRPYQFDHWDGVRRRRAGPRGSVGDVRGRRSRALPGR